MSRATLHRDGTVSDGHGVLLGRVRRELVVPISYPRRCHVEWRAYDAQGHFIITSLTRRDALEAVVLRARW